MHSPLGHTKALRMNAYHNQVQLIGRSGHDAELLTLSDGSRRATLRLYQRPSKGHPAGHRNSFTLKAWGDLAEQLARQVRRGDRILVQGRLVNRSLHLDGRVTIVTEVHISFFTILSSRSITRSVGVAAEPTAKAYGRHE